MRLLTSHLEGVSTLLRTPGPVRNSPAYLALVRAYEP